MICNGHEMELIRCCGGESQFRSDCQPGGQTSLETGMKLNYSSNSSDELPLSLPLSQNDLIKVGRRVPRV